MAGGNGKGRDDAFLSDVLRGIGAPVNAGTLAFMRAWTRYESGTVAANPDAASWNPLNSTLPQSGSSVFNSVGVRNYRSREQGLNATISTLKSKRHYYDDIVTALQRANPEAAMRALVASPWSGSHYSARKLASGGWDYRNTNIYRLYQQVIGETGSTVPVPHAATAADNADSGSYSLPAGLTSGDGTLGVAKYDPLTKALIDPKGRIWFPYSLWLAQASTAVRKGTRIVIVPGAYQAAGAGLDPGAVTEITPGTLAGEAADAVWPDDIQPWMQPFTWLTGNLSRIGLALLAVLIIVLAVVYQSRGSAMETAKVAAKLF